MDGFRRVHHAVSADGGGTDTEELREAMVGARGLFEQLVLGHPEKSGGSRHRSGRGSAGRNRTVSLRPKGTGA